MDFLLSICKVDFLTCTHDWKYTSSGSPETLSNFVAQLCEMEREYGACVSVTVRLCPVIFRQLTLH